MDDFQVVLDRRVRPQPSPNLNPGGDCGPCVLAGLLDIQVPEVYSRFTENGKPTSLSWHTMRQALFEARSSKIIDRLLDDVPFWPPYEAIAAWGAPGWGCGLEWFNRVTMAVDAGYYGLAEVNHARQGPLQDHDHWVMICGSRQRLEPHPTMPGAGSWEQEILVSCSASNVQGFWIEARDFLKTMGGYNVLLARPTRL